MERKPSLSKKRTRGRISNVKITLFRCTGNCTDIVATTWYRLTYADVIYSIKSVARMVKLVDTRDLKSLDRNVHAGSIPAPGTKINVLRAVLLRQIFLVSNLGH